MDVEVWSDIGCPWCYIGKRRLESALAQFDHSDAVTVTWRSFELAPDAPAEVAGDHAEILARKYGTTVEQIQKAQRRTTAVAAAEGLEYHLDRSRHGSTFDGHRLIHLAKRHGLQDAMKERLLSARLSRGELVSDRGTLIAAAAEVGLPEDEVLAMLDSDLFTDEVRADEAAARDLGITGVPTFVVDRQLGVSGAQPPEQLLGLLNHAWERLAAASESPA